MIFNKWNDRNCPIVNIAPKPKTSSANYHEESALPKASNLVSSFRYKSQIAPSSNPLQISSSFHPSSLLFSHRLTDFAALWNIFQFLVFPWSSKLQNGTFEDVKGNSLTKKARKRQIVFCNRKLSQDSKSEYMFLD